MSAPAAGIRACERLEELETVEILLVWSLRERLARGAESARLVQGFRQIFGLAEVENALASFEAVYRLLEHHLAPDGGLRPGSDRLSRDEALLLELRAADERGDSAQAAEIAGGRVGPVWAIILCDRVRTFAALLDQVRPGLEPRAVLTVAPVQARPADTRPREVRWEGRVPRALPFETSVRAAPSAPGVDRAVLPL